MAHIIGNTIKDSFLPIGSKVALQGRHFIIKGYKSSVNYIARDLSNGKDYLLRRSYSFIYEGHDDTIIADLAVKVTDMHSMGDPVKFTSGKFAGHVGIISAVNSSRYHIAIAGHGTITSPHANTSVVRATMEELAGYILAKV